MNGVRTLVAAVFLLFVSLVFDRVKGKKITLLGTTDKKEKRYVLFAGLVCGLSVTLASTIQQFGIQYTTVGKSGFLTTLYVVFTPLFALFLGRKIKWNGWVAAVLALVGMFFICIEKNEPLNVGDLLIIISSVFFGVQMVAVDKFVFRKNNVWKVRERKQKNKFFAKKKSKLTHEFHIHGIGSSK
jgi:drug/metabolite transporter (DMT)-like permease